VLLIFPRPFRESLARGDTLAEIHVF
jgi:hypothetical protein